MSLQLGQSFGSNYLLGLLGLGPALL